MRRHLVVAAGDRRDEALALTGRKLSQIECHFRAVQAHAVAGRAIGRIEFRAGLNLARRGGL